MTTALTTVSTNSSTCSSTVPATVLRNKSAISFSVSVDILSPARIGRSTATAGSALITPGTSTCVTTGDRSTATAGSVLITPGASTCVTTGGLVVVVVLWEAMSTTASTKFSVSSVAVPSSVTVLSRASKKRSRISSSASCDICSPCRGKAVVVTGPNGAGVPPGVLVPVTSVSSAVVVTGGRVVLTGLRVVVAR